MDSDSASPEWMYVVAHVIKLSLAVWVQLGDLMYLEHMHTAVRFARRFKVVVTLRLQLPPGSSLVRDGVTNGADMALTVMYGLNVVSRLAWRRSPHMI